MLIEQALLEILRDDAVVSALVGKRIFPVYMEQSTQYPALLFGIPTGPDSRVRLDQLEAPGVSGTAGGFDGLTTSRFHFVALAKGNGMQAYAQCKYLEAAVYLALQGYKGTVSDDQSPESNVWIDAIIATGWYSEGRDDQTGEYFVTTEFAVTHSESVPAVIHGSPEF